MCFVKQVHFGATLFNVLASPSDCDGAHTVFVPDPYVGQGVNCRKKKKVGRIVTTQYLGHRMTVILAP